MAKLLTYSSLIILVLLLPFSSIAEPGDGPPEPSELPGPPPKVSKGFVNKNANNQLDKMQDLGQLFDKPDNNTSDNDTSDNDFGPNVPEGPPDR